MKFKSIILYISIFALSLQLFACAPAKYGKAYVQGEIQAAQSAHGFVVQTIPTSTFTLYSLVRAAKGEADTLHVYIEGDGFAWVTRTRPSSNPTPTEATALHVAQKDPSENTVVYLARPCQYVTGAERKMCSQKFWTGGRFAPEVISATNQAIDVLKAQVQAKHVVLIGYSGGGAVAALVAAQRNDVAFLGSFAGNLDVDAWTTWHKITPLRASLKPLDVVDRIANIPQRHLLSHDDAIIPPAVNERFCKALAKTEYCQNISDIEHGGAWESVWDYTYN